jgi:site-specific recombinase XerD
MTKKGIIKMKSNNAIMMFKEFLVNRNFSEYTIKRYVREVRYFLLFIKKEDVKDLTKEDVFNYRKEIHRCGRYDSGSQRGIILSLSRFFKYLSRYEFILVDPFDSLDLKMAKRTTKRESVPEEDLKQFLDNIDGNSYLDLKDRAVFELLYGSGLRIGEACKLNMTDIDFQEGKAFIREGKGKKDRIVPIGKNTLNCIKAYIRKGRDYLKKIYDNDSLFLTYQGRRITPTNVEYVLKKRFKKMFGDKKICPHMLRHSFATHMLEAGAGIKQVKDILGHSSMQSTVTYTHFNTTSMKRIMKMYHPRENELYEEVKKEFDFID